MGKINYYIDEYDVAELLCKCFENHVTDKKINDYISASKAVINLIASYYERYEAQKLDEVRK